MKLDYEIKDGVTHIFQHGGAPEYTGEIISFDVPIEVAEVVARLIDNKTFETHEDALAYLLCQAIEHVFRPEALDTV